MDDDGPGRSGSARRTLDELLTEGLAHAPETPEGLSNHRPMGLAALFELGATADRLRAASARWAPAISARAERGDPAAEAFRQALAREGVGVVLRHALPALLPGVGAAAFHGLIRVAHAATVGHGGELAEGLAYWHARLLPLPSPAVSPARDLEAAAWFAELLALKAHAARAPGRLIFERMASWAVAPGFGGVAERLRLDDRTLPALAREAARLYAATGDFTVLHLVTGARALSSLLPRLDAPERALEPFARAAAAALFASDVEAPPRSPLAEARPWPDLVAAALASDDVHVVELVHACVAWHRDLGDGVFARAAARAVGGGEGGNGSR